MVTGLWELSVLFLICLVFDGCWVWCIMFGFWVVRVVVFWLGLVFDFVVCIVLIVIDVIVWGVLGLILFE